MCFFIPLIQALPSERADQITEMPDNTLYSSGSDPYFSKCDHLEMDLASGLWRGKSDRAVFRRRASDLAQ